MKILIGVGHPKHVHIFKNFAKTMASRGHEIRVVAVEKEITEFLLKKFEMPYELIGKNQPTILRKILNLPLLYYRTYKIAKKFRPDIFISRAAPNFAHVSAVLRKPFIVLEDTEHVKMLHKVTLPFANAVITPHCYMGETGKNRIKFNGYYELAYLHKNNFKPDYDIIKNAGLDANEKLIVMRLVSWNAIHDIKDGGFTNIKNVAESLKDYGKVLITSEYKLPQDLEKYRIDISPEKIHHLLYFATLYIGESATMATESAVLGTPSIFVSTSRRSYTDELENRYGLVYNYSDSNRQENALKKAVEILENENSKKEWVLKRIKMFGENMDVTKFIVDSIELYGKAK